MFKPFRIATAALIAGTLVVSCTKAPPPAAPVAPANPTAGSRTPPAGGYGYGSVGNFKDDAQSNTELNPDSLVLSFVDTAGNQVDLADYRGKKNVLLVFMRGFPGFICPNCTAQTSRLISNYEEFAKRDCEVLVVYPGDKQHVDDFVYRARQPVQGAKPVPFSILLDEDFAAVDQLNLRGDLAKPSTFIIDKEGQVRFAYVGASTADRPSIKAMLTQLDALGQ